MTGFQTQKLGEENAKEIGQNYQYVRLPVINNESAMPTLQKPFTQPKVDGSVQGAGNQMFISMLPSMNQNSNEFNFNQTSMSFSNLNGFKQPGTIIYNPVVSQPVSMTANEKSANFDGIGTNEHSNLSSDYIKEFQAKLFGLMMSQSKIMVDIREKHEVFQEALTCLISEVNDVK